MSYSLTLNFSGAPPERWETSLEWIAREIYEAAKQLISEFTETTGAEPTVKILYLGECIQEDLEFVITTICHDTFENAFPGFQTKWIENHFEATIHVE